MKPTNTAKKNLKQGKTPVPAGKAKAKSPKPVNKPGKQGDDANLADAAKSAQAGETKEGTQPAKRYAPYDLLKVRKAKDGLFETSNHVHIIHGFLMWCMRCEHSESELGDAFWNEEWAEWSPRHMFKTTVEKQAKFAFWLIGKNLEQAFSSLQFLYQDTGFHLHTLEKEQPDFVKSERGRRHVEWLQKLADWTGEALARHYAIIAGEVTGARERNKKGHSPTPTQTTNFLRSSIEGRKTDPPGNPFNKWWKEHTRSNELRRKSEIREFVKSSLERSKSESGDLMKVLWRAAREKNCTLPQRVSAKHWTPQQFKQGWPFVEKLLSQRLRDYNELLQLTPSSALTSARWGEEFKNWGYPEEFEYWKRTLIGETGCRSFEKTPKNWVNSDGRGGIRLACKREAEKILCRIKKGKQADWRVIEDVRVFNPDEDSVFFLPLPDWIIERRKMNLPVG